MNAARIWAGTAIAGTAAVLAAWQLARAGMQPTSQLFGPTVVDRPDDDPHRHAVALTYDDGPSPRNTPALLDLLAAHHARATFFLIGTHVRRHPGLTRRIAAAGHRIGNHTETHPNLALLSPSRVREELQSCQRTIEEATGITPHIFRPPYGARRPDVLRTARRLGLAPVLWNITAQDWQPIPAARMLATIDRAMQRNRERRRTSNLLLHDASHLDTAATLACRDATLRITAALLARPGLRFIPAA